MPVHNREIAKLFETLGDLLEIEGENPFRVRAYHEAARVIGGRSQGLAEMLEQGEDLTRLPGIGKEIAKKIETIVHTGSLPKLEEVKQRVPIGLIEVLAVGGLGPKRVQALWRELGVEGLADLRRAVEQGRVRQLEGFGAKTEARIKERLTHWQGEERRTSIVEAEEVANALADYLRAMDGVKDLEVAGSFRRRKETVGDLDILVTCRRGTPVMDRFAAYDAVEQVVSMGETRSTVRLRSGLQVDLRVVPQVSFGAALHYFTGSKAHNIAVRKRGVQRGLKLNEYGVLEGEQRIAGRTEEEVFASVGLPYIPPELREDRGEIEAAEGGALPDLVELVAIRGDLHAHTDASDGHDTLKAMAEAAARRGYEYLAITDHSRRLTVAHGLDEQRLRQQMEAIDRLNEELGGRLRVLKGIEVDILEDGRLDLPDAVLADLDLRVGAVHHKLGLPEKEQTERIIRAMDNPLLNILAHPTGRLIGSREAYAVDLERVMGAAAERGCFLEVNAQPKRLDLTDAACKMAKDMGVMVAISSDAHRVDDLAYLRLGVAQARRGWLTAGDVINTRGLAALRKLLRHA